MNSSKRVLALLLSAALVESSVPAGAWAQGARLRTLGRNLSTAALGVAGRTSLPPAFAAPVSHFPIAGGVSALADDKGGARREEGALAAVERAVEMAVAQPDQAEISQTALYDGGQAGLAVVDAPSLGWRATRSVVNGLAASRVGRLVPKRLVAKVNAPVPPKPRLKDDLHGPVFQKLGYKDQIVAGLKGGARLTGLGLVTGLGLQIISSLSSWQLRWPGLAKLAGRVELMAGIGPQQISEGLAQHPAKFLLWNVPKSVVAEEIIFRGMIFGGILAATAATGALGNWLGGFFERKGLDATAQLLPKALATVGSYAFPVAAAFSALLFGIAHTPVWNRVLMVTANFIPNWLTLLASLHTPAWGITPQTLLIPAVLGYSLAALAYKTRSLVAPLIAHLTYNMVLLGGMVAAAQPGWALPYAIFTVVGGVGFLAYPKLRSFFMGRAVETVLRVLPRAMAGTLALGILVGALTGPRPEPTGSLALTGAKPAVPIELVESESTRKMTTAEIAAVATPAVIQVLIKTHAGQQLGSGSGFIISKKGFAVTNAHVADHAGIGGKVGIRFIDDSETEATVLAMDTRRDIAFLQLHEKTDGYPTVSIASLDKLKALALGEPVTAIGFPLGSDLFVSRGVVGSLGGSRNMGFQIKSDVSVNPGNSGGPSFNEQGEVIGINTAIASRTGSFAGMSLLRSVDVLRQALKQYEETGSISPAWMGIIIDRTSPQGSDPGFIVELIKPGSAAAAAGLRAGDRIVRIEGKALPKDAQRSLTMVASVLSTKKLGDIVNVTIDRGVDTKTFSVTLGERLFKESPLLSLVPDNDGLSPEDPGQPDELD